MVEGRGWAVPAAPTSTLGTENKALPPPALGAVSGTLGPPSPPGSEGSQQAAL